ncbi:MAG: thiol peroxidase [Candidatus Sumerlaeia bacterium]
MIHREKAVTFKGDPLTLVGPELKIGDKAPAFKLVGNDLSDVSPDLYPGKLLVLSVVPSIDTSVCATQTRKFNEQASDLSDDVVILTVSMDLPFAFGRFCAAEGIDQVVTASDYKYRSFGEAYGVYIKELGLLTRAVFVVDKDGVIRHAEYVPEVTDEPDYQAALSAAQAAL